MSTHALRFRPSLITALVKVAMIGTWRGRTFLDDNREYDDIADFVPDAESATAVQLSLGSPTADPGHADPGRAGPGHSVAA